MQESRKIPITLDGQICGQAEIQREGLYDCFLCRCQPVSDAVLRAILQREDGMEIPLGVLVPEDGGLCLRRRIARSQTGGEGFAAVVLRGPDGAWEPWSGTVLDRTVTGALSRMVQGNRQVAMPFSPEEPFAHLALFCCCTPITIGGKLHLAVTISA